MDHTILMDETAIYLENCRSIMINEAGKRHVSLCSTGFASMWIMGLLSISTSGKKLAPVIICKKLGESGTCFERVGGCYICCNEKMWVNQDMIKAWIDFIFPPVMMSSGKAIV